MQSFERVVAFPDSKVIELLQPHQHLELQPQPYSTSIQRTMRYGLSSIKGISTFSRTLQIAHCAAGV